VLSILWLLTYRCLKVVGVGSCMTTDMKVWICMLHLCQYTEINLEHMVVDF
jgi:hypothetical protein